MKLLLSSFPRSAQHFLVAHIDEIFNKNKININFDHNHEMVSKDYDIVFSIIRNPFDCILSNVSMIMEYEYQDGDIEYNIKKYIKEQKNWYTVFMGYLLNKVDIIYKYEDVINNTKKVLEHLFLQISLNKKYNNIIVSHNIFSPKVQDDIKNNHLATSKKSKYYSIVKENLDTEDMENLFLLYEKVKIKTIKL